MHRQIFPPPYMSARNAVCVEKGRFWEPTLVWPTKSQYPSPCGFSVYPHVVSFRTLDKGTWICCDAVLPYTRLYRLGSNYGIVLKFFCSLLHDAFSNFRGKSQCQFSHGPVHFHASYYKFLVSLACNFRCLSIIKELYHWVAYFCGWLDLFRSLNRD